MVNKINFNQPNPHLENEDGSKLAQDEIDAINRQFAHDMKRHIKEQGQRRARASLPDFLVSPHCRLDLTEVTASSNQNEEDTTRLRKS